MDARNVHVLKHAAALARLQVKRQLVEHLLIVHRLERLLELCHVACSGGKAINTVAP